mmetsp:Transcript_5976/g.13916  ORF Transcript_5976/g.13916 Transcript_5976/m.13916 type:complete len:85 (-) Transcript_5976:789-1043(-)
MIMEIIPKNKFFDIEELYRRKRSVSTQPLQIAHLWIAKNIPNTARQFMHSDSSIQRKNKPAKLTMMVLKNGSKLLVFWIHLVNT